MVFEELFAETKDEKILDKLDTIIDLLKMEKQPMTYVPCPVYVETPWYHIYPSPVEYVYPERYDCVEALRYAFPEVYSIDYAEHVCLASACVST